MLFHYLTNFNTTILATSIQPQLAIPSSLVSSSDTYMFVMLDLDVPPAAGNTTRRVLLHALNTGFRATQQSISINSTVSSDKVLLASTERGPATYIGPSPPATDSKPHRYVELLFEQPSSFQLAASDFADRQARFNFDITNFMEENGLAEPLAANFFTVDGQTGAGVGPTTTSSGGINRSTLEPFEGQAESLGVSLGLMGILGAAVLVVM